MTFGGPVSWAYLVGAMAATAVNAGTSWPRTRDASALVLGSLMILGQLASMTAFALVDRPWSYGLDAPVDLVLLFVGLAASGMYVGRWALPAWERKPPMWLAVFVGALCCGLVLQAWLWIALIPHWAEPYNHFKWRLYLTHGQVSNALAAVEISCVAWPGITRHLLALRTFLGRRHGLSGVRRVGD